MKYLFLYILLLSTHLLTAQINYGLAVGTTGSNIDLSGELPAHSYLGWGINGHFFANRTITKHLILETGAGLSLRRTMFTPESGLNIISETDFPVDFWFIEIPIHLRYGFFGNRLQIGGGIVNSFLIEADFNIVSSMNKPYQLDLQGMAIWNVYRRFSIEVGYLYGGLNHLARSRKNNTAAFEQRVGHVGVRYNLK